MDEYIAPQVLRTNYGYSAAAIYIADRFGEGFAA